EFATCVQVLMKPMPDEAMRRRSRREVSPAKVRPDDRVEVRHALGSFTTTKKNSRSSCSGGCVSRCVVQAFDTNASTHASIGAYRKQSKWQPVLSLRRSSRTARHVVCKKLNRFRLERCSRQSSPLPLWCCLLRPG